ncbi:MAG: DUF4209 domain-containing protein [Thiomargarita sp.]|nr:DUF4209 domain-containing protein [Thiomargarita sp.]
MSELEDLTKTLNYFDNTSEPIKEKNVYDAVFKLVKGRQKHELSEELQAEIIAFDFLENHPIPNWNKYFTPIFPEFINLDEIAKFVDYWEKRAIEAKNPVLITRYADLVWEFSKIGSKFIMAKLAIDNILKLTEGNYYKGNYSKYIIVEKLIRALSLSISLKSLEHIEKVKKTIITYEDKIAEDNIIGSWGFAYDALYKNEKRSKKIKLTDKQKKKIIGDLEARLDRISSSFDNNDMKPLALENTIRRVEKTAFRLADYYRKISQPNEVKRVLLTWGTLFEKSNYSNDLLYIHLERVYFVYKSYGMQQEADAILIRLRELGPKTIPDCDLEQIKVFETAKKDFADYMYPYIEEILEGELDTVLKRVALFNIPCKETVKEQLIRFSQKYIGIYHIMPPQIKDYKGRTIHNIGTINSDLEGHIKFHLAEELRIKALYVRNLFSALIKKFNLSAQQLTDYIYQSPLFEFDRKAIIESGLQAYLQGNDLVAIHLLIPQVEDAVRNFVEKKGGKVMQSQGNGFHVISFDKLLKTPEFVRTFGKELGVDIQFYFQILFTDSCGWNLRNNLCHGITPFFDVSDTDRVVHSLLCLALVR